MGQSENEHWCEAHEVVTKVTKVEKGGRGTVNIWSLNQKKVVVVQLVCGP